MRLLAGRKPGAWQLLVWGIVGAAALVLVPLVPIQMQVVKGLRAEYADAIDDVRARHATLPAILEDEPAFLGRLAGLRIAFGRDGLESSLDDLRALLASDDAQRLLRREARLSEGWRPACNPQGLVRSLSGDMFEGFDRDDPDVPPDAVERLVLALDLASLFWSSGQHGTGIEDELFEDAELLGAQPGFAERTFEALDGRLAELTSRASVRDAIVGWWLMGLSDEFEPQHAPPAWALWDAERGLHWQIESARGTVEALDDLERCPETWTPTTGGALDISMRWRRLHLIQRRITLARWTLADSAFRARHGRFARTRAELATMFDAASAPAACAREPLDVELDFLFAQQGR